MDTEEDFKTNERKMSQNVCKSINNENGENRNNQKLTADLQPGIVKTTYDLVRTIPKQTETSQKRTQRYYGSSSMIKNHNRRKKITQKRRESPVFF